MLPQMQEVIAKLEDLSPERLQEVEDFIDFLRQRDSDRRLRLAFATASEEVFAKVWDNDDDAIHGEP